MTGREFSRSRGTTYRERHLDATERGPRVSSRTLWMISRASTSFRQLVGRRHRNQFPNSASSVSNRDSTLPWRVGGG